ncbi:uncharacterized protein [Gorilla gorilla gorilla]|uniref:uncharacterized protein isoform X1 n=1 Tax=Gorilla gorilla gorilla TaxID=9595 RepID=UPI00300B9131
MAVSALRSFLLPCEEGACFFFAFCHDCHVNRTPGTVQGPPVWPHAVTLSKGVTREVHGKAERCDVLEDPGGKHTQRTGAITRLRAAAESLAWATVVSSVEGGICPGRLCLWRRLMAPAYNKGHVHLAAWWRPWNTILQFWVP